MGVFLVRDQKYSGGNTNGIFLLYDMQEQGM